MFERKYYSLKRYDEAISDFSLAIKLIGGGHNPGDVQLAHLFHRRAYTLQLMGRQDEALADVNQALDLNPTYENAFNTKSIILIDLTRFDEAVAVLEQLLNLNPGYFAARINLIYIEMEKLHNYELAAKFCDGLDYEAALAEGSVLKKAEGEPTVVSKQLPIDQGPAQFYRNCALARQKMKDPTGEHVYTQLAASAAADSAEGLYFRGQARVDIGEMQGALSDFRQAFVKDPMFTDAYEKAAAVLFQQGRYEEAKQTYEGLLKVKPDYALAVEGVAAASYWLGDTKAALEQSEEAVRLDPSRATAWNTLAYSRGQQGDVQGAQKAFAEAFTRDPKNDKIALDYVDSLLRSGEIDGVEKVLKNLTQSHPNSIAYLGRYANVLSSQNKFAESLKIFQIILSIDSKSVEGLLGHAWAAYQLGDRGSAYADLESALTVDPQSKYGLTLRKFWTDRDALGSEAGLTAGLFTGTVLERLWRNDLRGGTIQAP